MKELSIDNVKQSFTLFVNEEGLFGINVKRIKDNEVIANILMIKEDVDDILKFIKEVYGDIVD